MPGTLFSVPEVAPGTVHNRLVKALAGLRRDAPISQFPGSQKGIECAVRFIGNHDLTKIGILERIVPGDPSIQRLLEEQHRTPEALQRSVNLKSAGEVQELPDGLELFVSVKGYTVSLETVQDGGNRLQPVQVLLQPATHLDLEVAVSVEIHDFLESLGETIGNPFLGELVRGRDGIHQPHGMAGVNALQRPQRRQITVPVQVGEILDFRMRAQSGQIVSYRLPERGWLQAAGCVQDSSIQESGSKAGNQGIQSRRTPRPQLGPITVHGELKGRQRSGALEIKLSGHPDRVTKLIKVLLVAEIGVLVKPFRSQHFRRNSLPRSPAAVADPDAQQHLRSFPQNDDSKTKRESQANLPLERLHCLESDLHQAHLSKRDCRRCTWREISIRGVPGRLVFQSHPASVSALDHNLSNTLEIRRNQIPAGPTNLHLELYVHRSYRTLPLPLL